MSRNMFKNRMAQPVEEQCSNLWCDVGKSPSSSTKKCRSLFLLTLFALLACMLTTASCSKKEFDELVSKAKNDLDKVKKSADEEISKAIGTASEELGMSGKASIQLDQPIITSACYVSLIKQSPDRPNVLKMQSYTSPETESFPSIFMQAQVGNSSLQELVDTEVLAQLFVQAEQNGEVWYTDPAELVRVKISALQEDMLTADVVSGKLYSTKTGNSIESTGKIEAVVQ